MGAAVIAAALLASALGLGEPVAEAGRFVDDSVRVAGERHRFAVWLPPGYGARRAWPAILFLHGSGECGTDGRKPTVIGLGPALEKRPDAWPFVVIFPQKASDQEEWEEREDLVFAVLDHARRRYHVAKGPLAFAGMSQGAHGVWMIGARHPERWSCLVPVCGYGRERTISRRVARLPVWTFHGLRDDLVNPDDTRHIAAGIEAERARLGLDTLETRITLYPEANHDAWDPAFAEPELPRWIASHAVTRPSAESATGTPGARSSSRGPSR
jgi:predicted peptidase